MRWRWIIAVLASIPAAARGAPVTVSFEGTITDFGPLSGAFAYASVGDPFSGSYTFDDSVLPQRDGLAGFEGTRSVAYDFSDLPAVGFSLEVGTLSVSVGAPGSATGRLSIARGFTAAPDGSPVDGWDLYGIDLTESVEMRDSTTETRNLLAITHVFEARSILPEAMVGRAILSGGQIVYLDPPITTEPFPLAPGPARRIEGFLGATGLVFIESESFTPARLEFIDGVPTFIPAVRTFSGFGGTVTRWWPVPEPRAFVLVALGLAATLGASRGGRPRHARALSPAAVRSPRGRGGARSRRDRRTGS